jgi:hypothetical protein
MEYLQGQTLAEYLKHKRERKETFSPRAAYNTIAHLCQGLQALHEKTCHGALTPHNIYVTRNGRFKITNLGYARFAAELSVQKNRGPYADSPFMPPEVRDNPLATSSSADLYAVAMLTAELLSPQPIEFGGSISPREQALRVAAHFGEPMARLLEQALSDDPDQRPETIGQLRDMLKAVCEAIPEQESPSVAPPVAHDLEEESGFYKVNIPVADPGEPAPLPTLATLLPPSALGKTGEAPRLAAAPAAPAEEVEVFQGGAASAPKPPEAPAAAAPKAPEEDPFAKAAKALGRTGALPTFTGSFPVTQAQEKRYLVSRDGLDYGPFDREEVLAQLHKDEITPVMDRTTQLRKPLGEMSEFYEAAKAHIPVREARKRREAETRAQRVETVKKAGKWTGVVGVMAALAMGGLVAFYWFFIRPQPVKLETQSLLADLGAQYKMAPPPREFAQIAMSDDILKELFAQEDPAAPKGKGGGGGRRLGKGGAGGGLAGEDDNISDLDLGGEGDAGHVLTDSEIQQTIRRHTGALGGCMRNELKVNPGFKGVSIQFFIKPSGTTGGVKINGSASPGAVSCLTSGVRSMRFPAHGGLNKGVNLPFYLK